MSEFLKQLFGRDTRGVRTLNLWIHIGWVYLILAHQGHLTKIFLPKNILDNHVFILASAITTVIVTFFTFGETPKSQEWKLKTKYVSLVCGALTQAVIVTQYVATYPPLSPMIFVCTSICVWLILGAVYVKYAYADQPKDGSNVRSGP